MEETMSALSDQQIVSLLESVPEWHIESEELVRIFQFHDFVAAMRFVNHVAELAEASGHHPDIDIRYNRVRLALITHDAGGLTRKDFDLAFQADKAI
jgi:4a-hydroxytetrahydrobiopterin dehydratase